MNRRKFIQSSILLATAMPHFILTAQSAKQSGSSFGWMPEESEAHLCTWMSFIASDLIWARQQVPQVQRDLASIATAIAQFEPVKILVRAQDRAIVKQLLAGSYPYPISLFEFPMNDLWMRDTGPAFVVNARGNKRAINFNFNGWGEDQAYALDAKIADYVAGQANVNSIVSSLTLEGGCFEVDGKGSAIMAESCILNDNRNPNVTKDEVEAELKYLLGLEKIIWLKGIKGKDITDGHTDFYARFARPGVVVVSRDIDPYSYDYKVTRENIKTLKTATDAKGKPLELVILDTPKTFNSQFGDKDFAAGYVGYYVCNGGIIMQKFGDKLADKKAKASLAKVFPNHEIVQLAVDGVASGGGSIHCATQQEPKV